jgi:hypothetical protein
VGAHNIAAKHGGGSTSASVPALVVHRRAGVVPARRDRRRHLYDRRGRSCLASGLPEECGPSSGCRSSDAGSYPHLARIRQRRPSRRTLPEGALLHHDRFRPSRSHRPAPGRAPEPYSPDRVTGCRRGPPPLRSTT